MQSSSFIKNISTGIGKRLNLIWHNPYRKLNLNWFKLKYYKHLPPGKLQVHKLFGKALYFYSASELLHGFKEVFIEEVYKQEFRQKPFIIDCGANIGMSIIYLKRLRPDAEIIAFEPNEKFWIAFQKYQWFQYEDVTLRKEAVWNENVVLKFSDEGSMSSKITDSNSKNTKDVSGVRLKDFLTKKIDFLKIDIEGAEFVVLTDLKDNLHHVQNLLIKLVEILSRTKNYQ